MNQTSSELLQFAVDLFLQAATAVLNLLPMLVVATKRRHSPANTRRGILDGCIITTDDVIIFILATNNILSVVVPEPVNVISFFRSAAQPDAGWYGGAQSCAFYRVTTVWFALNRNVILLCLCFRWLHNWQTQGRGANEFQYSALGRDMAIVEANGPGTLSSTRTQNLSTTASVFQYLSIIAGSLAALAVSASPLFGLAPTFYSPLAEQCQSWLTVKVTKPTQHASFVLFTLFAYTTLVVSAVCCMRLVHYMRNATKHETRDQGEQTEQLTELTQLERTAMSRTDEFRASKMVICFTTVSTVAWLPFLILLVLLKSQLIESKRAVSTMMQFTILLPLVDPLILGAFLPSYWSGYRRLWDAFLRNLLECARCSFGRTQRAAYMAQRGSPSSSAINEHFSPSTVARGSPAVTEKPDKKVVKRSATWREKNGYGTLNEEVENLCKARMKEDSTSDLCQEDSVSLDGRAAAATARALARDREQRAGHVTGQTRDSDSVDSLLGDEDLRELETKV